MTTQTQRTDGGQLTISVLDVGHGNCTVVTDEVTTILIDTGPGAAVLEYLLSEGISRINTVVLSHADSDHIGGLTALMATAAFEVDEIVLNSDSSKSSAAWKALAYEIDDLIQAHRLSIRPSIRTGDVINVGIPDVEIVALAPRQRLAQLGPGSADLSGRRITTNTHSAVLQVKVNDRSILLLPGDLDFVGFEHLVDSRLDLAADYLVLPHHGGSVGTLAETKRMTYELCAAVSPLHVFISNSRNRFDNPRVEVIQSVREASPKCHIECAQLSKRCSAQLPKSDMSHLHPLHADGRIKGECCAGSIRLGIGSVHDKSPHSTFVDQFAVTALCRQQH